MHYNANALCIICIHIINTIKFLVFFVIQNYAKFDISALQQTPWSVEVSRICPAVMSYDVISGVLCSKKVKVC